MPKPKSSPKKLALVLSGGGARGAYEAGILHYLRTMLPKRARYRRFDVHCGASVGAINTCYMVSTADDPERQGKELHQIWENLRTDNIYRRDTKALFDFLNRSSRGIVLNFLRRKGKHPHFLGFLDTTPFHPFIQKVIPWPMISRNIRSGLIQALSIVATNVFTGRMELFIEKNPKTVYRGDNIVHYTRIQPIHAAASAAMPLVFPTIMIDGIAYTDGGLRLNTPLSPAIHLGADAILVIGLHHRAGPGEKIPFHGIRGQPPALGQVLGRVMNSIFLDRINNDMEQLHRINRMIEWSEKLYGKNFLRDLNAMIRRRGSKGDVLAARGLKKIGFLRIRPSQDIGEIFNHCYRHERHEHLTNFEKFLIRFLDIDPTAGIDFLSYISFMPKYLKSLLELGFEDARRNHDALKDFLES
jgi:NTE family protein